MTEDMTAETTGTAIEAEVDMTMTIADAVDVVDVAVDLVADMVEIDMIIEVVVDTPPPGRLPGDMATGRVIQSVAMDNQLFLLLLQ